MARLLRGTNDVAVSKGRPEGYLRNAVVRLLFESADEGGGLLGYGGVNPHRIHDGMRKLRMGIQDQIA